MDDDFIKLADAIALIRAQLREAQESGADVEPRFAVGPVELELELVAHRDVGGGGGLQFGVFTAKTHASLSQVRTHRIRLTLTPTAADGGSYDVASAVIQPPPR